MAPSVGYPVHAHTMAWPDDTVRDRCKVLLDYCVTERHLGD